MKQLLLLVISAVLLQQSGTQDTVADTKYNINNISNLESQFQTNTNATQQERPIIINNITNSTPRMEAKQMPSKSSTTKRPKREMQSDSPKKKWNAKKGMGIQPNQINRVFKLSYPEVIYDGHNLTDAEIQSDLNIYFQKILNNEAGNDTYTYPRLKGTDFENPSIRAMYFYRTRKLKNYRIDFPNPQYFKISLKIDPCRAKGDNDLCCDGTNEAVCEDNPGISAGTDVSVAWLMTGYVAMCSDLFQEKGTCGTYIEIHKPNNEISLEEKLITKQISNGYTTEFISTKNLCAGKYELWLVVRTRNGSILQYVKPFYSEYPPCQPVINLIDQGEQISFIDPDAKVVFNNSQIFDFNWFYTKSN